MKNKSTNPFSSKKPLSNKAEFSFLILHNDDINTFDHVINSLIEVCEHDFIQAEQCAFITHHKGKCDIKRGKLKSMKEMKDKLTQKGLIVSIEK